MIPFKTSDQLAQFLNFLRSCAQEYQYYCSMLIEVEKRQTDLLHFLELDESGYKERIKIGTQLRKCLRERRIIKDRVEELKPIADFLSDPKNKGLLDKLSQVLGETRKAEKYHSNRVYKPRVLASPTVNPVSTINRENKNL